MEILSGIHELKESLAPVFDDPRSWISIYIIVADQVAIVDSGVPRSAEGLILPYLKQLGIAPGRVGAIVNSHGHGDHIGSNTTLREALGAPILIHEADQHFLLAKNQFYGSDPIEAHKPDRLLPDGDTLDLGSRTFDVVHLPGHSPGSIGLLDRSSGVLISGDSLQGLGTSVQNLPLIFNPDAYARTMERAMSLQFEHLLMAHPYIPMTASSWTSGGDMRHFLDVSSRFVAEIDDRLVSVLNNTSGPLSATEVAGMVCREYGQPGTTSMADITIDAYLSRLAKQGRAADIGMGTGRRYQAV